MIVSSLKHNKKYNERKISIGTNSMLPEFLRDPPG